MKRLLPYIMALFYMVPGICHFVNPAAYIKIMPTYLPYHLPLVYVSGSIEFFLGILLISERTRAVAAWFVIALLLAVFPANIQMAINYRQEHNPLLWLAIARLPLQWVLIWWAWLYTRNSKSEATLRKA